MGAEVTTTLKYIKFVIQALLWFVLLQDPFLLLQLPQFQRFGITGQ
jgi:hypothetical protein